MEPLKPKFKVGDWVVIHNCDFSPVHNGWVGQIVGFLDAIRYEISYLPGARSTDNGWGNDNFLRAATTSEVMAARLTDGTVDPAETITLTA